MTDREMLELAAKAAGLTLYEHVPGLIVTGSPETKDVDYERWNPLTDDGDAMRLAIRLGFAVGPGRCWHSPYDPAFVEDVLDGELKSTRRAIVRAAAEIGRAMP